MLLVDPKSALTGQLHSGLKEAGFQVMTAESASDCLTRLEETEIAGVISSHSLPDLDGVQLLRSIRVSYPSLPFILVPDDGSESLAGDALAAGADGYVPHTEAPATIVSRLEKSLTQHTRSHDTNANGPRYRHLIEISPAPINVFDETGTSIWCNRAILDLLGLESRDELIGESIFDVIHPDDHDLAREELETVIEEKKSIGPTQMKLSPRNRDVRYIRVSTAVGEFLGEDIGQAIAIDVTEREERSRQLQILDQWLRHNIRNEMTVIMGIADQIEQEAAIDIAEKARKIKDRANDLVKQANHERELIGILTPSADRNPTPIDIPAVVEHHVTECREDYPAAEITLDRRDEFTVSALHEIGTAVRELLVNAIQHNDTETPQVDVELARRSDGKGFIRVMDNGPGIPETERKSLLLDQEIDQLYHSSGLGLVHVYWVVRLSGGTIDFEENDPRGSVVTLVLPVCE
ncbi:MAG: ATP-binding protein [Halobacteriales archaeon]